MGGAAQEYGKRELMIKESGCAGVRGGATLK